MADQIAFLAEETVVDIGDTVDGEFAAIGNLNGDILLPTSERDLAEFQDHSATAPKVHAGPKKLSVIELAVTYQSKSQYDALAAKDDGLEHYVRFTLENGDYYIYKIVVNKAGPVGSLIEGYNIMTFGFKACSLAAHGIES